MNTQPPQLDYAKLGAWHGRKRVRRWIILIVFITAAIVGGIHWGPRVRHRLEVYRAQRHCMNYAAPQGQLIYATEVGDRFLHIETNAFRQPPPACWVELKSSLPDPVSLPIREKEYFDAPFRELAPAPALLHSRKRGGKHRLVVVQFGKQVLDGNVRRVLCCRVVEPATLFRGPRLISEQSTIIVSSFEWAVVANVFAGKIDESDSSHFVIDITVDNQPKTIDGWLQDDDTVKMEVRAGPAKQP